MINDEKYQISSTGTLTINKIDLEDQGDYVCIGKNDIGENQTEVKLTVKGKLWGCKVLCEIAVSIDQISVLF